MDGDFGSNPKRCSMSEAWATEGDWLLRSAVGGGLLLLLAWGFMGATRQPARRQRLGEFGVAAALLLAGLSLARFSLIDLPVSVAVPALQPGAAAAQHPAMGEPANEPEEEEPGAPLRFDAVALVPGFWPPDLGPGEESPIADCRLQIADWKPQSADPRTELSNLQSAICNLQSEVDVPRAVAGWLVLAYAAGAAGFLGRWLLGHVALWWLLRQAGPAPAAVARLFAEMAAGARPRLLVSRRLRVPLSCGLLRPAVVLPAAFCEPAAAPALPWVFAHELTHLARRDAWSGLLFALGQAVYYYLPCYWWLRRQVRLCQEYVADAAAVAQPGRAEDYAQFLLSLTATPAVPAGATGVSGHSSDLFRRITMLLQTPFAVDKRCPRLWSVLAAGCLTALAVVAAGVGLRAEAAPDRAPVLVPAPTPDPAPVAQADVVQPARRVRGVVVVVPDAEPAQRADVVRPARRVRELGLRATEDDPPQKDESQKEADARARRKVAVDLEELRKALERLPQGANLEQIEQEVKQALEALKKAQQVDVQKHLDQAGKALAQLTGRVGRAGDGRLGVQVDKPSATLAEQLDLPKGKGLVINHVLADSAAAKAGLKVNDILLEVDGKPVSNEYHELVQLVDELKANTPVDVVVLRKGKRETIKGVTLPEKTGRRIVIAPVPPLPPLAPLQPFPNIQLQGFGGRGILTSVFRTGDRFTTRHQEGSLIMTVTGTVADGKTQVKEIQVQDGGATNKYDAVDKVPEQYRDKVRNLIEMTDKGSVKIEIKSAPKEE
jgi:membrane-associated protease RseP (regulator of RpoE activity)